MKAAIFDIENWREIGQTLARNKTRTFLTAFGIFWGTALLAMLWGGAAGLHGLMFRNLEGFSTNIGAILPGRTSISYKGYNKGMSWSLREADIEQIRRTSPYIDLSSTILEDYKTLKHGTNSTQCDIQGVEVDEYGISRPNIHYGRVLNDSDIAQARKVVVLGRNVAESLFGNELDNAVGQFIDLGGIYFQVVGIISQFSKTATIGQSYDEIAMIPTSTMRNLFVHGDSFGFFVFTAKPGYSPQEVKPAIIRAICNNHPIHPDDDAAYWFIDASEMFRQIDKLFMGLNLLALFVGIGSLLAGIIGVGNIMWIIVKERTHEIGIRRAIGAKPRDIIAQILSESIVLTTIAGIAGICFGAIVLQILDMATSDPDLGAAGFQLQFGHAAAILAAFVVLGAAAGTIPAIKSMKIKPIEAINDK